MRALLAALLLVPAVALAYDAVAPAPGLDAVRLFNATEVTHLEPADVRLELRYASGVPAAAPTLEVRAEVGLTSHFQLDLAEDIAAPAGQSIQPSATPIGLRYSLGSSENAIRLNPAVELTVAPRTRAPARAGLRLLLAEERVPRLVVAANGYLEQNVERDTPAGADGVLGMTGGVSYSFLRGHLHLGAEGQVAEAQYGRPDYHLVLAAGPNAVLSAGPCAATLTSMLNLAPNRVGLEPMGSVGCTF